MMQDYQDPHHRCCFRSGAVSAQGDVTGRAGMLDLLHALHTEGNEAAAQITTEQTENTAAEIGHAATLRVCPAGEGFRDYN